MIIIFLLPLKFLSEKTAFPSIIIDALPLLSSIFLIRFFTLPLFSKPLSTANFFEIFTRFSRFILCLSNFFILFNDFRPALLILLLIFLFEITFFVSSLLKHL